MPLRKILFVKRIKAVLGLSAKQQKASSRVFKAFNGLFSFLCLFVQEILFSAPKLTFRNVPVEVKIFGRRRKKRKEGQELKELESDQKKRC